MGTPDQLLRRLERLKDRYGAPFAREKTQIVDELSRRRLRTAAAVARLHEALAFLHAFPDDARLLASVERALLAFGARGDLKRHRGSLIDSGIAGTRTYYRFFWPTAGWLARRCPDDITIDWVDFENSEQFVELLPLLLPYGEAVALETLSFSPREWIARLKGPDETDALFVIRRFSGLRSDSFGRERLYESLDVPICISPGRRTPTRTGAKYGAARVVFQERSPSRARPSLLDEARRPPDAVRTVSRAEGQRFIDMATEAMIARARDLDAFAYGDPADVRLVECGGGLQFVCIGVRPERRLMLEAVYGCLTLRNGVPTGYVLASSLFASTEIAFNVFETFRGVEAARTFGRVLGMARHLFGADAFSIDPYQLGYANAEGLASGAWWFYYKLGFRPEDASLRRLVTRERARMRRKRGHRSSPATLAKLASEPVFFSLKEGKRDILGAWPGGNSGLQIASYVAARFGSDRERASRVLERDAAKLLGLRSRRGFSAGERLAWRRFSPLIMTLPGVERWSRSERQAMVGVVRAKGGRRESDFVRRFDAHKKLRRAVWRLAAE